MMKLFSTILVFIAISSVLTVPNQAEGVTNTDPANRIRNKHKMDQYHKYGFLCTSSGGGGDGKRYKHLILGFDTKEQLTIDLARKYIVESILSFMRDINNTSELQQHFTEWPFKSDKLTYTINVSVGNGVWPIFPNGLTPEQKISYVSFDHNKIRYLIDVHRDKLPQTVHRETLDEAIAILKAEGWKEPSRHHSHTQ